MKRIEEENNWLLILLEKDNDFKSDFIDNHFYEKEDEPTFNSQGPKLYIKTKY